MFKCANFNVFRTLLAKFVVGYCVLALTGCYTSDVKLVSGVNQTAANSIILVLGNNNIDSKKSVAKDGTYTIEVAHRDQVTALAILKANGQPEQKFSTMGEVFKKIVLYLRH